VIELFVKSSRATKHSQRKSKKTKLKRFWVLQKKIKREDIEDDAPNSRKQRDKLYTQIILNISLVSCRLCNHEETW
jgi:hypothetical protein